MSEILFIFIMLGILVFALIMFKAQSDLNKLNHEYAKLTGQVYLEGLKVFIPKRTADED